MQDSETTGLLSQDKDKNFQEYLNFWKNVTWGVLIWSVLYHILEGGLSIYYGLDDDSISLAAFGVDSAIEVFSTIIVLYHMAVYELMDNKTGGGGASNLMSLEQERIGTILIGFLLIAFGCGAIVVGILRLIYEQEPNSELASLIIASVVFIIMLIFWVIKTKAAVVLNSSVLTSDANCSLGCIKVTIALLIGSLIYIIIPSLWWVDSVTVIIIGILVGYEGYETVNGAWDKNNFGGGCGCCDGSDTYLAQWMRNRMNNKYGNKVSYGTTNTKTTNNNNNNGCQDECCNDKNKNINKNNNNNNNEQLLNETNECTKDCCKNKNTNKNSKNNNSNNNQYSRSYNTMTNSNSSLLEFESKVNSNIKVIVTENDNSSNVNDNGLFNEIIDLDEWTDVLNKQEKPVFVFFTADWSNDSKKISTRLLSLVNKHSNKFYYVKINVDEADDIAIECKATVIPTFQIYKESKMIKSLSNPTIEQLFQAFESQSKSQ